MVVCLLESPQLLTFFLLFSFCIELLLCVVIYNRQTCNDARIMGSRPFWALTRQSQSSGESLKFLNLVEVYASIFGVKTRSGFWSLCLGLVITARFINWWEYDHYMAVSVGDFEEENVGKIVIQRTGCMIQLIISGTMSCDFVSCYCLSLYSEISPWTCWLIDFGHIYEQLCG
jgi:hypothetical protein